MLSLLDFRYRAVFLLIGIWPLLSFGLVDGSGHFRGKCSERAELSNEIGFYLRDHIYVWTHRPIQRGYPTLLYVAGGPGASARSQSQALNAAIGSDINVVFFDPRGVACSRRLKEAGNSFEVYSSEQQADDIERVRQQIAVPKWSILASSSGTVPATIYAARHPDRVVQVLLEGTVFSGGAELYHSPIKLKILRELYSSLTPAQQESVRSLSQGKHAGWFSVLVDQLFYKFQARERFHNWIQARLAQSNEVLASQIAVFQPRVLNLTDQEWNFSENVFGQITCNELGGRSPRSSFEYNLTDQGFSESGDFTVNEKFCQRVPLRGRIYSAGVYRIVAPVYYFQAQEDLATVAKGAFRHYRQVAAGSKRFFLFQSSGHMVLSDSLTSSNESARHGARRLVRELLLKERLDPEVERDFIISSEVPVMNLEGVK